MNKRLFPRGFESPVLIGQGGFGTVYRAFQPQLNRHVVVKVISIQKKSDRERLLQEAAMQAELRLPWAPPVYEVFLWKKQLCLVMQYIRSVSLQYLFPKLSHKNFRFIIAEKLICATASFHSSGYSHGDLKPSNVLLSPQDGLYLIDFGLSRKADELRKTADARVAGTAGYIAPELFQGSETPSDFIRADVYSLGMILKQILGFENLEPEKIKIIEMCCRQNPLERPANAHEVKRMWGGHFSNEDSIPWPEICDEPTRIFLSDKLVKSARQLIAHRKLTQAYRLLIECQKLMPDNSEAVDLIRHFHLLTRRKNARSAVLKAALAFLIFGAGLGGYYYYVYQHKRVDAIFFTDTLRQPSGYPKVELHQNNENKLPKTSFRISYASPKMLTGRVELILPENFKGLVVNGKPAQLTPGGKAGLVLPPGRYQLSCVLTNNKVLVKTVVLKMFQKSKVSFENKQYIRGVR